MREIEDRGVSSESSSYGSEDHQSENCAGGTVQRSSVDRPAGGRRRIELVPPGPPVQAGHGDVDSELRDRTTPADGRDARGAVARADLADRVQRRIRRRVELQSRVQAAVRDVAEGVPGETRPAAERGDV